jgi:hypothetical protein
LTQINSNQNSQNEEVFVDYKVGGLLNKVKKRNVINKIKSPRNNSKIKMLILFLFGTFLLLGLLYAAISEVTLSGKKNYLFYLNQYIQKNSQAGWITIAISVVVNLFWIIINIIIDYLAYARNWIPIANNHIHPEEAITVNNIDFEKTENNTKLVYEQEIENKIVDIKNQLQEKIKLDLAEDKAEAEALMESAFLSLFTFLWSFSKRIYRFLTYSIYFLQVIYLKMLIYLKKTFEVISEFYFNLVEAIIYFFNPINIFIELSDITFILLMKILYPALLTPIIIILPVKYNLVFTDFWNVAIYFILIGMLRLGVEFYSLYLRFLRNTLNFN